MEQDLQYKPAPFCGYFRLEPSAVAGGQLKGH